MYCQNGKQEKLNFQKPFYFKTSMNAATCASSLHDQGYAVFPFKMDGIGADAFSTAVEAFPEYKSGAPGPKDLGWGAMSAPSSFHCPYARKVRRWYRRHMKAIIRAYNSEYETDYKLQILFDRMYQNAKGKKITAEGYHRDVYANGEELEDDHLILGGFVAIEGDQRMKLCPATHKEHTLKEVSQNKSGFAKIDKGEWGQYDSIVKDVNVPEGHCIIFFQHLVHKVAGGVMPLRKRVFVGSSLAQHGTPIFAKQCKDMDEQATMQLPSGQPKTNTYSVNHFTCFKSKKFEAAPGVVYQGGPDWAAQNINESYLDSTKSYAKPMCGKAFKLRATDRYAPYTKKERKIYTPRSVV